MNYTDSKITFIRPLFTGKLLMELAMTILFLLLPSLASAINQGRVHVKQNIFALEGDSVTIEMEIALNEAQVNSNSYVLLTPMLCTGDTSKSLPSIRINGRRQHKAWKRLVSLGKTDKNLTMVINASDKKNAPAYLYRETLPFEPWMGKAEFILREDQCDCSGPLIPMSFELLAKNLEDRNTLYEPVLAATFITPEVETIKNRCESGKAYLDYPVNVSAIRTEFSNNATELQRIYNLIEWVRNDPDATITGIKIIGYASPEGSYHSNLTLSKNRAMALADLLKIKYGFQTGLLHPEGKGEDWQTLDSLVELSDMKEKKQILTIIRDTDIFDGREKMLMDISGGVPYSEMFREIFPKLRRSDYELNYTVLPFTVEKGKEVIKTRPSSLSLNEMFLIANTYEPGSDDFNEVFETAARIFPQSDVANLNAAASALKRKDILSAEKYLNKIKEKTAACRNNLGVLYALKKEYEKAMEQFLEAQTEGNTQAAGNMDEITKPTRPNIKNWQPNN